MKRQQAAVSPIKGLNADEYQILVDELMKDQPDQGLVQRLMLKQGIPYTKDPISQMSLVLQSLSHTSLKSKDPASL